MIETQTSHLEHSITLSPTHSSMSSLNPSLHELLKFLHSEFLSPLLISGSLHPPFLVNDHVTYVSICLLPASLRVHGVKREIPRMMPTECFRFVVTWRLHKFPQSKLWKDNYCVKYCVSHWGWRIHPRPPNTKGDVFFSAYPVSHILFKSPVQMPLGPTHSA